MKLIIPVIFLFLSCVANSQVLSTASYVDINRYIGKWYAVKALPQFFTRNCRAQTAEYDIIDTQTISVVNTCIKEKGVTVIKGKGVVKNPVTNAELIVTFNNFFTRLFRVKGDYTIIKLDEEYRYVMVGSKDRKSLWFLSRTTTMPVEVLEEYTEFANQEGFNTERMITSRF